MYSDSVFKTVIAMLVSATMAFPAQLWAQDSAPAANDQGSATDGIPVILEPVQLKDGRTGYFVVAPYLEAQETAIVAHFAANDPKHLILGVAGPDDPALKTALETGNLAWINSYIVADASQANAIQKAPAGLRQRLKDKIKRITDLCKNQKAGLITTVIAAGIVSGYVGIHSSSIPAGMLSFSALMAWVGFQAVYSEGWDHYLEKGGEFFTKFMTWAVGRDVSVGERNLYETAGQFHALWLVNSGIEWAVLGAAGASHGFNLDGFLQAGWYGFLGSTEILDAAVKQKIKQGKVSPAFFNKFVIWRLLGAAIFQVAGYLQLHGVQAGMASMITFTAIYMALSHLADPKIEKRIEAIKNAGLRARAGAGRAVVYANRDGNLARCEYRLTGRKPPTDVAKGEPAE